MSQIISGATTSFNYPNYQGLLFVSSNVRTPFLQLLGGLNQGRSEANREFVTGQYTGVGTPSQPSISENAATVAPAAVTYAPSQYTNVVQTHQSKVSVTYPASQQTGRIDGVATQGNGLPSISPLDRQVAAHMQRHAIDVNLSLIHGTYNKGANADEADTTRGILEALTAAGLGNNKNVTALSSADDEPAVPTVADFNGTLIKMYENNAQFINPVMFMSAKGKQWVSETFGFAPTSRTVGGVNLQSIVTDFGEIPVVIDQMVANGGTDNILIVDMAVVELVFNPTPDRGNFFLEPLAKVGASDDYHLYGRVGLDHGPDFYHGAITGIEWS